MKRTVNFANDTAQPLFIAQAAERLHDKRYHIVTYGCQMNSHDSEKIAGLLHQMGMTVTDDVAQADLVLFNTCCVREHAENKVYGNVGALVHQKAQNPDLIIGVCGCMMQQEKAAAKLLNKMRHVDFAFGTHNLHELPEMLLEVMNNGKRLNRAVEAEGTVVEGLPVLRQPSITAFVTIMYGCDNFCTYCIVPHVRGRERSREPGKIVEEIASLVQTGVREVTLLGQNVNSYGAGEGLSFAQLLRLIEKEVPDLSRIRFMTSHPKDLSDELIDAMAASKVICNQIHLPVQSGSDRILKQMNRHYTAQQYLHLLEKLRARMPGIGISSDFIVGFPGETEEDFQQTLALVEAARLNSAFTFKYSSRTGTAAAAMPDQLPDEVKRERLARLNALQTGIGVELDEGLVSTKQTVLVETGSKRRTTQVTGRTESGRTVNLTGGQELAGQLVNVTITGVMSNTLKGQLI